MSVYKDTKQGTWYVSFRYVDWTGEKKQKLKRGFRTKREALEYETEFKRKATADMDMELGSCVEIYFEDKKLSIENIGLIDRIERLRKKISSLENEVSWLRDDAKAQNYKIERLKEQEMDYNRVKRYMGEDRVQQVVDTVKVMEEQEREQKRLIRSRGWSR